MAKKLEGQRYNFIFERTSMPGTKNIEILEEQGSNTGVKRVIARALMQEASVQNNNRRIYSEPICESIVNQLSPKASSRSLLMEIDHPLFVSSNPDVLKRRAAIVEIGNSGAALSNIIFADKKIVGIFETLSGLIL